MTKEIVLQCSFDVINQNCTEWGIDDDNCKEFASFVDGVCNMTKKILDTLNEDK